MSMKLFDTLLERSSAARFERQRQEGKNFQQVRVAAGLTLTAVAAYVGITDQQLALFELGVSSNLNGKDWSTLRKELEEAVMVLVAS